MRHTLHTRCSGIRAVLYGFTNSAPFTPERGTAVRGDRLLAGGRAKLVGAGMLSKSLMAQHLADRETLAAAHTTQVGCG